MIRRAAMVSMICTLVACEPEPTTYEDCVLQKIEDVSDDSAKLLDHACREKFPRS